MEAWWLLRQPGLLQKQKALALALRRLGYQANRQRVEDVERFLTPGAPPAPRRRILDTYNVSKVLLDAPHLGLAAELSPYGVVHRPTGTFAVIDVTRGRAAAPLDPSEAS